MITLLSSGVMLIESILTLRLPYIFTHLATTVVMPLFLLFNTFENKTYFGAVIIILPVLEGFFDSVTHSINIEVCSISWFRNWYNGIGIIKPFKTSANLNTYILKKNVVLPYLSNFVCYLIYVTGITSKNFTMY